MLADKAPSRARKILQKGDSIFATIRPRLQRVAFVDSRHDGEIASTAFCLLRPKLDKVVPRYLYYLLRTNFVLDRIALHEGGASYPAVSDSDVLDCAISLPPKPEQEKIAAVLWQLQQAIATQDKQIATTRELKQATMAQLFTRGIHGEPQKETEIGFIPSSWTVESLGNLCAFASGGTPSKSDPNLWKNEIPWASPKDFKRPRLHDTKDHVSRASIGKGTNLTPVGSVMIVVRGMILAKDVPVALVEAPMAFNQDVKAMIPCKRLNAEFLLYSLEARKHDLFQRIGTAAHGTRSLLAHELTSFAIALPDKGQQIAIGGALSTLDKKFVHHQRKRAALDDLFQTLLHKLMTAEIRVADLDIDIREIAAVAV